MIELTTKFWVDLIAWLILCFVTGRFAHKSEDSYITHGAAIGSTIAYYTISDMLYMVLFAIVFMGVWALVPKIIKAIKEKNG